MRPLANPGSSAFRWNTGAWLGSQVGCTCWLLTGGVQLFSESLLVSLLWLAVFLLANCLGLARGDSGSGYKCTRLCSSFSFVSRC